MADKELSQLISVVKGISFDTIRTDKDDYFEAVFKKDNLNQVNAILDNFFGKSLYPGVANLPKDVEIIIDNLGGIMTGQTLYFYKAQTHCIFAMLWPWQNKVQITLKVGKVNI